MKKIFLLLMLALAVTTVGCGGSSHSSRKANTALTGAWISSSSSTGTAKITSVNYDADELEEFTKLLGNIPEDVLKQYNEANKNKAESVTVPVTNAMAVFESSGAAVKLTAIFVLSGDTEYLPLILQDVELSAAVSSLAEHNRSINTGANAWTADIPGGTLTINNIGSGEKIKITGTVRYLDYDCEFETVIEKDTPNELDIQEVLNGTWTLNSAQAGGYNAAAASVPETVSLHFNFDSDLKGSVTSFYSLNLKNSANNNALLQTINSGSDYTLTQIYGNLYQLKSSSSNSKPIDGIIFIENIDEIFMFTADENGGVMFLPLKKVNIDLEAAMKKTWTAASGGGYLKCGGMDNPDNDPAIEFIKELDTFSFILQDAELKLSNIKFNNAEAVTADSDISISFVLTNKTLDELLAAAGLANEAVTIYDTVHAGMARSGNFLKFTDEDSIYNIVFISDTDAFLKISSTEDAGVDYGEFAIRLQAK
ncbi:MAG: hypothetical protein IJ576_03885 [Synergistaceae bacterium]|nr:hypothetical protein [Synergistaceae bacterium]